MNQLAARPVPLRTTNVLAIATAVAVLPLIVLGSVVTTMKYGMVDPEAVRSPWYFLAELAQNNDNIAWIIEHGHRQAGWIVGLLAIATTVSAFTLDGRGWVKGLTLASLVAVIVQGLLGIFRIRMHDLFGPNAAWIHGSFAPIAIALLITQAVATSKGWSIAGEPSKGIRQVILWTLLLLYLQIVTGGWIRHRDALPGGRFHLMLAFMTFTIVFKALKMAMALDRIAFRWPCRILGVLFMLQLMLGIESWMGWMRRPFLEAGQTDSIALQITRSSHYVIGALIFAATATIAAKLFFAPRSDVPTLPGELQHAIQEARA